MTPRSNYLGVIFNKITYSFDLYESQYIHLLYILLINVYKVSHRISMNEKVLIKIRSQYKVRSLTYVVTIISKWQKL